METIMVEFIAAFEAKAAWMYLCHVQFSTLAHRAFGECLERELEGLVDHLGHIANAQANRKHARRTCLLS